MSKERTPLGQLILDRSPLTRHAIAKALGIPRQWPYQWESGERTPSPEQMEGLSHILDVDLDHLYAVAGRIPPDIERSLKHADADTLRAVRIILR